MNKIKILLLCVITLVTTVCVAGVDETNLPLSFSPQGMPAISVTIQGKKIPLAFDTISDKSALSEKIIKKYHLKLIPSKTKCYHDSTGKKQCLQSFVIPAIRIGNFTVHNVSGLKRDYMWNKKPDRKFIVTDAYRNGVIGLDVLSQFNLLIDYSHERAVLIKQGLYPKNYNVQNWIKVPFMLAKYGITTRAKINGVDILLSWLTAANHSVIMQPTMNKISHVPHECPSFIPDKLIVAGKKIPSAEFHIVNEGFPFEVIGSSYFQKHVIFIDFKNKYLFIQK